MDAHPQSGTTARTNRTTPRFNITNPLSYVPWRAGRVKAERPAEGLVAFAQREGVTHVIFGQSARSRWELLWRGSTLDRFLSAVPDAAVQVVPLNEE